MPKLLCNCISNDSRIIFDTHHIGLVLVFVYSDDTAPSQAFANNGAPTNSTAHNSDKCNPTKSSIPILLSLFSPSVSS